MPVYVIFQINIFQNAKYDNKVSQVAYTHANINRQIIMCVCITQAKVRCLIYITMPEGECIYIRKHTSACI